MRVYIYIYIYLFLFIFIYIIMSPFSSLDRSPETNSSFRLSLELRNSETILSRLTVLAYGNSCQMK